MNLFKKVKAAEKYLKSCIKEVPEYAVIAGTGLSDLSSDIKNGTVVDYQDIPFFPRPTVEGHEGKMIFGEISGKQVVVLRGRFHYYEGYTMDEVTFYVRVLSMLGIQYFIISNASGSLNPDIDSGDIVFINDHINLFPENPLRGFNDLRLGKRFPSMDKVYGKHLLDKAQKLAHDYQFKFHTGVYVGLQGPSLETAAEYKYLGHLGGDVVGMSTVPEVIVAAQSEVTVLCISVCTNNPFKGTIATSIEEVLDVAKQTGVKVRLLIKDLLAQC